MSKVFAGFLAATLLVLAVGCSGSDDDALVECISVLVDVATDHTRQYSFRGSYGQEVSDVTMPSTWINDHIPADDDFYRPGTDIRRSSDAVDRFVDEKCAPFLGVSVAEQPVP